MSIGWCRAWHADCHTTILSEGKQAKREMMDNQADRNASIKKLAELIEHIDIAMFTTIDDNGTLRSRPMSTQQIEFDGDLWFFAGASSATAHEVRRDQRVNISYAQPDQQRYVSVS